ncbi:MAG: alpha/beta hydrolase [Gammaproteobacteria bacterium]|nr:alpha/beta hydrolase [Gammaproteobacteria bacterium]
MEGYMADILIVHGAWSAGWAWKKMRPLIAGAGHRLWTPTMTGLGERQHLAHPDIDLNTHIKDITTLLTMEDLRDVVLVGHSYGGIVATGVADRARERIAQLIYLDAYVPADGQSALDLASPATAARHQAVATKEGDGWRVTPNPLPDDTSEDDAQWAAPRRVAQPLKTLSTPLQLIAGPLTVKRSYILCTRNPAFSSFGAAARTAGWTYRELDASHNPHITMPQTLAAMLLDLAAA